MVQANVNTRNASLVSLHTLISMKFKIQTINKINLTTVCFLFAFFPRMQFRYVFPLFFSVFTIFSFLSSVCAFLTMISMLSARPMKSPSEMPVSGKLPGMDLLINVFNMWFATKRVFKIFFNLRCCLGFSRISVLTYNLTLECPGSKDKYLFVF